MLLFFVLAAVVLTYPMAFRVAGAQPEHPDALLNTWMIAWGAHALLHQPLHLFDANIFYPHPNTFAYSEHQLGSALLALPVILATGEPLIAVNLLLLFSFAALGFGTYLLAYHHLRSVPGALVAGLVFAFAPFRFIHMPHVQLTTIQWLPFVFLFLARYLDDRRRADLLWFGVFYLLQMLTTMYIGAFMSVTIVVYLLLVALVRRRKAPLRAYLLPLVAMAVCVAALTPIILHYVALQRQPGFARGELENVAFSARPVDFLTPSPQQTLYRVLASRALPALEQRWESEGPFTLMEHTLFPGVALVCLAALGAWVWRPGRVLWLPIAALGLILSLGPRLGSVPMPYWLLYKVVPGFSGIRAPSRFVIIGLFGMAILAGAAVAWLWKRPERPLRGVLAAGLLVLAAEQLCLPVKLGQVSLLRSAPAVYRRLAAMPGKFPIVELPMGVHVDGRWDYMAPMPESRRIYFSALHWKPLVNGWSSFLPADYPDRVYLINRFPLPEAQQALADLGVRYAVVHPGDYPDSIRNLVMRRILTMPGVERYDDTVLVPISPQGR